MEDNAKITGFERAGLMRIAHRLQPVATVGQKGLTDQLREHIDRELDNHELIKIRFTDFKERTSEFTEKVAEDVGAILVATIGHVGVLYRPHTDPDRRHVELPKRRSR